MPPVVLRFLALGALTGVLAAASVMYPLADLGAPRLFGYCFGIGGSGDRCDGISASFYCFPGVIFGIGCGAALLATGRLDAARAAVFVLTSGVANAVAVFLCVWLFNPLGDLTKVEFLDAPLALAGAISGAAGGVLLSGVTAWLVPHAAVRRSTAAAAALGLLVPLVVEFGFTGAFAFYALWQAGYAAALAADMLPER